MRDVFGRKERLKQTPPDFFAHPDAVVRHFQHHFTIEHSTAQRQRRIYIRALRHRKPRIVEQVGQHLLKLSRVTSHRRQWRERTHHP